MRSRKNIKITAMFIATVIVGILLFLSSKTYIRKSHEAEIKSILSGYMTAEEAYRKEYGTYTADEQKLGFNYVSEGIEIYFEYEKIPMSYRRHIASENLPHVNNDTFKILLIKKSTASKNMEFWTLDNKRNIFSAIK